MEPVDEGDFIRIGEFSYPKRSAEEVIKEIDTTLTPTQQIYVDKLKKMIKGGANSKPSQYREVPKPEDVKPLGNFMPNVPDNAEALIDWALSHAPAKMGTRGSRRRKRWAFTHAKKRFHDAIKKDQMCKGEVRRQARLVRIRGEVRAMRAEALVVNAAREERDRTNLAKYIAANTK
jgi:hypothetical protein